MVTKPKGLMSPFCLNLRVTEVFNFPFFWFQFKVQIGSQGYQ